MFRHMFRILLLPITLVIRILLGCFAFVASVSSAVIGLLTSSLVIFSLVEFFIGYWQNGIVLLVIAILTSPIGLLAIANFILRRADNICSFVEYRIG